MRTGEGGQEVRRRNQEMTSRPAGTKRSQTTKAGGRLRKKRHRRRVSKAVLNFLLWRDETNLVSSGFNIHVTFQTNPRQLDYSHGTEPPPIFLRPMKIWLSCQSSAVSCLVSSIIQPLSLSSTKTYILFLLHPFLTFVRDYVMSRPKKEEKATETGEKAETDAI